MRGQSRDGGRFLVYLSILPGILAGRANFSERGSVSRSLGGAGSCAALPRSLSVLTRCGSQTRAPIALRLCRAESHPTIFAVFAGFPASAVLRKQKRISSF